MKWIDDSPASALPVWQGEAPPHLQVRIDARVLEQVRSHLRAAPVEQGGLLLGVAYAPRARGAGPAQDAEAAQETDRAGEPCVVRVLAAVAATHSRGDALSLRMDTPVWTEASVRLDTLRECEPCALVVGWYHSHPGIGAFFSATDRRTQRAWFGHPYSLGWVMDPVRDEHAIYLGPQCRPVRDVLVDPPAATLGTPA